MTISSAGATASRSTGAIVSIVVGAILLLLALAPLGGGAALVAMHSTQRDADGYYASGANEIGTPTHALVSEGLAVGTDAPDWLFRDGRLGTVRVTATGTRSEPVFVGVARQSDVDSYLHGVAHDEVTDFDLDPFEVTSTRRVGDATPSAPADRSFWAEQSAGSGEQTITWPVQEGTWAVVVMNADGSSGVGTDVSVGAKVGYLLWVGVGLLAAGGLLAVGGAALIFSGARTPRRRPPTGTWTTTRPGEWRPPTRSAHPEPKEAT